MAKPFHAVPMTPSVDVNAFLTKVQQYRKHCAVESIKDQVLLCRQLEACVDMELSYLKKPPSARASAVPADTQSIVRLTRDTWRTELLLKLKNTLVKITALL
jgi:hypothetical protein